MRYAGGNEGRGKVRPGAHGDRNARPAYSTGSKTYKNHLNVQDLERHGLAYICEHPEILFSGANDAENDPAYSAYRSGVAAGYDSVGHDNRTLDGVAPEATDGLLMRVSEAYEILNDIYAPYSTRTTEQRGQHARSYGTSRRPSYRRTAPFQRRYG